MAAGWRGAWVRVQVPVGPCSGAAPWPPTAQQVVLDTPHFRAGPVVLPQVDGKGSAVAGAAGLPRSRCDINNEEKQGSCC